MNLDFGCLPIISSPLSRSDSKKAGSDSLMVSFSQSKYSFHKDILLGFFANANWNLYSIY